MKPTVLVGLTLLGLAIPSVTEAIPRRRATAAAPVPVPPSLTLRVEPARDGATWRWSLTNAGTAPVEVVTDRRLLWVEVAAPAGAAPRARRGAHAVARSVCAYETRPETNELAPRTRLEPGERYAERVDLRDICHLRVPPAMAPGATVTVHYGFGALGSSRPVRSGRRGDGPSSTRSVVFAENGAVIEDLAVAVAAPRPAEEPPARSSGTPGVAAPGLEASGGQAATGEGLRVTVRFENPSVQPLWVVWRTGLLEFNVTRPDGRQQVCSALTRPSNPQRELFVRLPPHAHRAMIVAPAAWCPRGTFDAAGVYEARVNYRNLADGREFGFPRVLTGRVTADPFVLRVSRGNGRYVPLAPEVTGGDAATRRH